VDRHNTFEGKEEKINLRLKMRRDKYKVPFLPNTISMPNINIKYEIFILGNQPLSNFT